MNSYLGWNDALARRFFSPDMAGRNVHLYVNQKLISDLETTLEPALGKFLDAIKLGPPGATREGVCQRALQAFHYWRSAGREYPPYIAYLCLFVLAGGAEGEFAVNAYYPRLRELLGEAGEGTLPSFSRMDDLWDDLETWSVLDKHGDFGLFRARHIGGYVHVGFPLAQTMLTEQERQFLPRLFFDAGLDPTSNPPSDELARSLRRFGVGRLQARTMRLVNTRDDPELLQALLSAIAEELAEWDGQVPDTTAGVVSAKLGFAGLRVCLDLDVTAQRAVSTLRCKLNREFPEDGVFLKVPGDPIRLLAEDYLSGWSTPLHNAVNGETIDASRFDWESGVSMRAESGGWRVKLPGRQVRVFLEGTPEGLPGLIEVPALPRGQPFFLAYSQSSGAIVDKWIRSQCTGFVDYPSLRGLPVGWKLGRVEAANSDEALKDQFPFMSFPAASRLKLVGGIRSSRGANFFSFAPPQVLLEGAPSGTVVLCNGERLVSIDGIGIYHLPVGLPVESRIDIEAMHGSRSLERQSLFLTGDFSVNVSDQPLCLNRFGEVVDSPGDSAVYLAGTTIYGESTPNESPADLFEDLGVELSNSPGYLIGRRPGQIASWPLRSWSSEWKPVWAVCRKGRRRQALFVGENPDEASPERQPAGGQREVRRWKEIVWYERKKIVAPRLPSLKALWKEYMEVAHGV